jgi:transposase-like protein
MADKSKRGRLDSAVMFPMIKLFVESKMTQKQFCAEMDLVPHTFTYWLNKYRRSIKSKFQSKPTGDFVSLNVTSTTPAKESVRQIRITYPDGTLIELPI